MSNSLDPDEMQSYSSSHLDPKLFAYGTIVSSGGLKVKEILPRKKLFQLYRSNVKVTEI